MKSISTALVCTLLVASSLAAKVKKDPCDCVSDGVEVCGSNGITYSSECDLDCSTGGKIRLIGRLPCGQIIDSVGRPCVCPKIFKPVCGSDGVTYPNSCMLKCAQREDIKIQMAYEGQCQAVQMFSHPPCACPRDYRPVCGSDGKTYGNMCTFKCAQKYSQDLAMVFDGECADKPADIPTNDHCICTKEYMPVCGTDGKTYSNMCTFNCAKGSNHNLALQHSGECHQGMVLNAADPCICTKEYMPVCGSDGKTYANKCTFQCAQSSQHNLALSYYGECLQKIPVLAVSNPCICTREYMPVCGTDGKTYANKCTFQCAQSTQHSLTLLHHGECLQKIPVSAAHNPCICTREYMPVCGTDGQTYANMCTFQCAQSTQHNLAVQHHGECEVNMRVLAVRRPCICTMEYMPVCGTDGHTYGNMCGLKCAQSTQHNLAVQYHGECRNQSPILPIRDPCICTKEYMPVCGSDGKTYGNMCTFQCANQYKTGMVVQHSGECKDMAQ